jgi:hypothetical protein
MKLFNWLSMAFFGAAAVNAQAGNSPDPTELLIETTFMPEPCTYKAQSGDKIKVHYVRVHAILTIKELSNVHYV